MSAGRLLSATINASLWNSCSDQNRQRAAAASDVDRPRRVRNCAREKGIAPPHAHAVAHRRGAEFATILFKGLLSGAQEWCRGAADGRALGDLCHTNKKLC